MGNVPFTPDQRQEIAEGTRDGLDVSIYAKPEFLAIQMRQIRKGLENGFDLSPLKKLPGDEEAKAQTSVSDQCRCPSDTTGRGGKV